MGYVATNNVHYAHAEQSRLQDVLVSIRHNIPLDEADLELRANSEYVLKSGQEMQRLFASYPEALSNTLYIAEQCDFEPRYGLQDLPLYPTPNGISAIAYLRQLCQQSGRFRLARRIDTELQVIEDAGLANYFLVVWDIVRYAREQGIRCQGRGSAANSLVAYLLGISPIDPVAHDLVFERFLSAERQIVPDIDIDFDAARREEVIQYIYERYGIEHAAMACTFITYGSLSDRIGRKPLITGGLWVTAGGIALFALATDTTLWFLAAAVMGAGTAMVYPTFLAAMSDLAHPRWRASALGVYRLWRDSGYAFGALLGGVLSDIFSIQIAVLIIAVLTVFSGVITAIFLPETVQLSHAPIVASQGLPHSQDVS